MTYIIQHLQSSNCKKNGASDHHRIIIYIYNLHGQTAVIQRWIHPGRSPGHGRLGASTPPRHGLVHGAAGGGAGGGGHRGSRGRTWWKGDEMGHL